LYWPTVVAYFHPLRVSFPRLFLVGLAFAFLSLPALEYLQRPFIFSDALERLDSTFSFLLIFLVRATVNSFAPTDLSSHSPMLLRMCFVSPFLRTTPRTLCAVLFNLTPDSTSSFNWPPRRNFTAYAPPSPEPLRVVGRPPSLTFLYLSLIFVFGVVNASLFWDPVTKHAPTPL